LTIAFFNTNNSIGDATNLLKILSVYRLFGPIVTGSLLGAIPYINNLARVGSGWFNI
jgi:hypothetical protein